MSLLVINNVSLAYGHHALLSNATLRINAGERLCLVGRNGTGKSTLLRLLAGMAEADEGEIQFRDTLRISYLQQEVPDDIRSPVYDVVASGLGELGKLLTEYHAVSRHADPAKLRALSGLQQGIDILDGWNMGQKVDTVLSKLSLPADKMFDECSGGIRRRVMLAQALVSKPDLLLLDEPTNHMDIASITWLEEFLLGFPGALVFVTHDRTLVRHLATRIIELDRGRLTSFPGNYDEYLEKKQHLLDVELQADTRFDRKLAEYEVWIRQGIKARRTRNEGRVRQLQAMRELRRQRIGQPSRVRLDMDSGDTSGKLVIEAQDISFQYEDNPIISNFSCRIMRGDRIGIMGANGCGKSTLLKLLLGELRADPGKVRRGSKLQIAYFDQQRNQLDPEKSIRENISPGADHVQIGERSLHIVSYMKDFLFPPERINSPVKSLSGGERNRLLLARLFTRPANLLVMDEPTNDLDVETLELLEELLAEYSGTLLLVSHDRSFLDRVVTSTIVFDAAGRVREYIGGYEDWLRQRPASNPATARAPVRGSEKNSSRNTTRKNKIGFREQRELDALPDTIETLEREKLELEARLASSDFYKQEKDNIVATVSQLEKLQQDLAAAYARWEQLDSV